MVGNGADCDEPFSITQSEFEKNVSNTVNYDQYGRKFDYVTLAKPKLENIVLHWKKHQENMKPFHKHFLTTSSTYEKESYQKLKIFPLHNLFALLLGRK